MKLSKKLFLLPVLAAAVLLSSLAVFAAGTTAPEKTELVLDPLNVKPDTVSSNVFALGRSFSGLTYDEAADVISKHVKGLLGATVFMVNAETNEKWERTLAELGVTYDDQSVRDLIRGSVVSGNLLERYKKAKDYELEPLELSLGNRFNSAYIMETITDAVKSWNHDPVESSASCITGELVIDYGMNGYEFRVEDSVRELLTVLQNDEITSEGFELVPEYTVVEAILSPERMRGFSVIGSCTTTYDKATTEVNANRQQNLIVSARNMTGQVFAPGAEISALNLYGAVTYERGYRKAGTFTPTGHSDEIGGGICQTTSTLYNAVLMAELEVIYRRNHSYMISYLPPSQDAMVYYQGGNDFKFRNSTSDYLIIDAYVNTDETTLTVNLIGHEDQPETHSVRYESEVLEMRAPSVAKHYSMNLMLGFSDANKYQAEDFIASAYCKSRLWKVSIDDGVESRTLVNTDTYKAMNTSITLAYDLDCEFVLDEDYNLSFDIFFIDSNKTSIAVDFSKYSAKQREAFNKEMTELLAAKELVWPGEGNSYTRYVKRNGVWKYVEIIPNTLPKDNSEEGTAEEGTTEAGTSGSD